MGGGRVYSFSLEKGQKVAFRSFLSSFFFFSNFGSVAGRVFHSYNKTVLWQASAWNRFWRDFLEVWGPSEANFSKVCFGRIPCGNFHTMATSKIVTGKSLDSPEQGNVDKMSEKYRKIVRKMSKNCLEGLETQFSDNFCLFGRSFCLVTLSNARPLQ